MTTDSSFNCTMESSVNITKDQSSPASSRMSNRRTVKKLELRLLLQKVKVQRILGIASSPKAVGSVEEYLKEVVTPLDEDDLTDSKGHKQCNCSSLKEDKERLEKQMKCLEKDVNRYKLQVATGSVEAIDKMRKYYYGDDDVGEIEKGENEKLTEENWRLTKKLLERENDYYRSYEDCENLRTKLREAEYNLNTLKFQNAAMYGYNNYGSYSPTYNSSTSWGRHGNDRRF